MFVVVLRKFTIFQAYESGRPARMTPDPLQSHSGVITINSGSGSRAAAPVERGAKLAVLGRAARLNTSSLLR